MARTKSLADQWADEGGSAVTGGSFWKPQNPGDAIRGVLVRIRKGRGKYEQNVADIRSSDNVLHAVGLTELLESRISGDMVGSEIGIIYEGKADTGAGGNQYNLYSVFVF